MALIKILILIFVFSLSVASATPMAHAKNLLKQAQYQKALTYIQQLLQRKNISSSKLHKFYWLLGVSYISLGKTKQAKNNFIKLLKLRPDFYPNAKISPKIREPFVKTRRQFLLSNKYKNNYSPNQTIKITNNNIILDFNTPIKHVNLVSAVRLFFRTPEQSSYRSFLARNYINSSNIYHTALPQEYLRAKTIYYYVEFNGHYGKPFLFIGSHNNPQIIKPYQSQNNTTYELNNKNNTNKSSSSNINWPTYIGLTLSSASLAAYLFSYFL